LATAGVSNRFGITPTPSIAPETLAERVEAVFGGPFRLFVISSGVGEWLEVLGDTDAETR
jgi:hypothetical protein